ncbi:GntR family transcriptional regulator [Azorhizobium doebereinerae]|uniref:GntR family transcriptional regulator n=1 Tax=Azorhizobium doebereinerae TaxID=281091 RepID=UPI0004281EF0|nr:GntR family transcriptional regulator [Azorhizobium doebereinerae]
MEQMGERAGAIYRALRRAILEQALEPGTKLPEDTIGEQFGASRTVVRRALEQLSSEELVDIRPNRGAAVAKPTPAEARDLFSVRQDIEQLVVRRVCGKLTPEHVARLEEQIANEERAQQEGRQDYIRYAAEFHVILAEMTGSPLLHRYMRLLVGRSALVLGLYGRPQWSNCSVHEHRDLLRALVEGDLERVSGMMHTHLDAVLSRALVTVSEDGERGIREILAPYAQVSAEA